MPGTETADPEMTTGGTILLPYGSRPWKACGELSHPLIAHGYLYKRDDGLWLLTTDSYIACALKIEGDAEDGFVHRDVLKELSRIDRTATQRNDRSWRVELPDGHRVLDILLLGTDPKYPFSVMEEAGMWDDTARGYRAERVALNPYLTVRLMKAMGIPSDLGGGVRLQLTGPAKAMRVTNVAYPDRIGLQMPMRATDT